MSPSESTAEREILSSRLLNAPRGQVFRAYREPEHLAKWWGPEDFTNTFHTFEFKPGGRWHFTMHGPDGTDYDNESVFAEIDENERIVLDHLSNPHFHMIATLAEEDGKTRLTWRMIFETAEICAQFRPICDPKNEENFDRLEAELVRMDETSRELSFTRILDAPARNLYRCWTEPALVTQWFTPPPFKTIRAELDVRPGGGSLIVMQAPDGTEMPNPGVYLEVVPNERLVFTDAFVKAWEPSAKPFMAATITFEDLGNGQTRYTARARHWTVEDCKAHAQMGFYEGWGVATDQLAALAATL